jgi:hemolysin D
MAKTPSLRPALPRGMQVALPEDAMTDETGRAVLEYESPSAALIARPVPATSRHVAWYIFALVVAMVVVATTVPVDRVVSAPGKVSAISGNISVQALDVSIVRSVKVKEGQLVKKGELLAQLDPTFTAADVGALKTSIASLQAEVDRLTAEQNDKPYVSDGSPASIQQLVIFTQRHAEQSYRMENYKQKIDGIQVKVAQAMADMRSLGERLAYARTVEEKRRELERLQVGSQLNTLAAMDQRAEVARQLDTAKSSLDAARRELDAQVAERDTYVQQHRAETSQSLIEQDRKLQDAREQLNKAQLRRDLVELRANTDAIVLSVAQVNPGSVLNAGQEIMTLVPTDAPLQIESIVDGREAGFVHVGDPVVIKFETFPYSTYGTAEGVVRVVSPDSFKDPNAPTGDRAQATAARSRSDEVFGAMFYRAKMSLDAIKLHDLPPDFRIAPGMPVTADVKIGKRTVMQYLVQRFVPMVTEGFREP